MTLRFRAWHEGHKKMISPEEMAADQMTLLPTGQFINVHSGSTQLSEVYDHMIPMLSTGLFDKNGTEIFEGDIVRSHHNNSATEIKFGQFEWEFGDGESQSIVGFHWANEPFGLDAYNSTNHYEVIGNACEGGLPL